MRLSDDTDTYLIKKSVNAYNVTVGEECYIGMGANVIQNRTVGAGSIVGAGAVVIDDIPSGVTVVGIPARIVKK